MTPEQAESLATGLESSLSGIELSQQACRELATAVARGLPRETVVRMAERMAPGMDPMEAVRESTYRYMRIVCTPVSLHCGMILDKLRAIVDLAMEEGELAAARAALKDYWSIAKDMGALASEVNEATGGAVTEDDLSSEDEDE